MPVYRKPHEKNFTVIDNGYLQDKDLGTKAKGLLTIMLSLPDDWKFSRDGLLAIYKEGETSLTATLNELKRKGYLSIRKFKSDSADADPFVYSYDIFESPDVRVPENRVLGNRILDDRVLENPVTYKELNNQELNNKILSNKIHSHQIRVGAGGGSDEDDDLNGEDGTEGEDRDDISVSENGKRIPTRSLTARTDEQECEARGTWRPKNSSTDEHSSQCSGGVHASTVPDAITCRTERGAEYGAATVSLALRASAQTLSASVRRPPTSDQRPATVPSVAYALRQGIALSENNLKELEDFAAKLGDEAVVWAVDEALAGGKKFYAYVRGILNKRVAMGAKSMDDIRQMEERRHNGTDQCFGREGPGDAPGRFDCDITV